MTWLDGPQGVLEAFVEASRPWQTSARHLPDADMAIVRRRLANEAAYRAWYASMMANPIEHARHLARRRELERGTRTEANRRYKAGLRQDPVRWARYREQQRARERSPEHRAKRREYERAYRRTPEGREKVLSAKRRSRARAAA